MPSKRVVAFSLEGQFAHFRRGYSSRTALTLPFPPKTALAGLVGAIVGAPLPNPSWSVDPDTFSVAVKPNVPIRTMMFPMTYRQAPPGFSRNNKPTLIPLEFIVRPSYTVYASFTDDAQMDELIQRLQDQTCVYTPCLGITELLADIRYLGEGTAMPEPPGAKDVATVCRKAFCWLDMDRIATDNRYLFQEVMVQSAGHRVTGFSPPDRYILNLNPHPLPLQMMAPAHRFGDEVITFL